MSDQQCSYCDGQELVYKLEVRGGHVFRCIPCLAIEQAQEPFSMPFEEFVDNTKHEDSPIFESEEEWYEHREMQYRDARDWVRVLARIVDDDPMVKRDPEAISTLHESTRSFLTNVMGSDAHQRPSELVSGEHGGHPVTEYGGKDDGD